MTKREHRAQAAIDLPFHFVITGRPVSKKNGRPIRRNRRTGNRFVGNNDKYLGWEPWAVAQTLVGAATDSWQSLIRWRHVVHTPIF